ncbi:MAG: murein biosynthesis integral membrane protein MurJ [SAR324 cluster bacterium]|nr:murein biosynthesis integral membrane protein MurJ [SAR324 cluster bacterium]
MSNNLIKSSAKVAGLNLASRLLGFAREILKTSLLGATGIGDAFQIAFTIPNLFRRLTAEGVMLSTFLPIFSDAHQSKGRDGANQFLFSLFWFLTIFLVSITLLSTYYADVLLANLFGFVGDTLKQAILLTRVMFGYVVLISLAALFQGVLNHHRNFWLPAITPILLNICIISAGLISYYWRKDIALGMAWGVLIGGAIQVFIQLPFVLKYGYSLVKGAFSWYPYLSKMMKIAVPGIIGAGIYQIDVFISQIIATTLIAGSVVSLSVSGRLLELGLGVYVISQTTVLLPSIIKFFAKNEIKKATTMLQDSLALISFFIIPITLGLMATSRSVIDLFLGWGKFDQRAIEITAKVLMFHLPGMIFIGWNRALIVGYQAKKMFIVTMWIAFFTMLSNISLAYYLASILGVAGIAMASSLSQMGQFFLLAIFLYKKTSLNLSWEKIIGKSVIKHLIAGGIMFICVWLLSKFEFAYPNLLLAGQIFIGIFIYIGVSWLLKTIELRNVYQVFLKRKNKSS